MVINKMKLKFGFSLFEAFVVMMVVAVFIALIANTISHRPKTKLAGEAHGRFECYYDLTTHKVKQELFIEQSSNGATTAPTDSDGKQFCSFAPPINAKYMIIDAVGGGAGGDDRGGASEGQYVSAFYDSLPASYRVYLGVGGTVETKSDGTHVGSNGGDSIVKDPSDNVLVTANGGKSLASLENTTVDDILGCTVPEDGYTKVNKFYCNMPAYCWIENGEIKVNYCRSKGVYATKTLTYKHVNSDGTVEMNNPRYIVNGLYTTRKDAQTWVYHDVSLVTDSNDTDLNPLERMVNYHPDRSGSNYYELKNQSVPSLYMLELKMNTLAEGDAETPSNLSRFIDSMRYTSGIKGAKVGYGGAKNKAGYHGGVLFLW